MARAPHIIPRRPSSSPPHSSAVLSEIAETASTMCDRHLQSISRGGGLHDLAEDLKL